jgi:DnaJ homolog subfamily B member 4
VTRNIQDTQSTRQETKNLVVEIKPGYKPGTKIRYEGEGDQINGAKQDIVFVIKQKQHQYYEREGDDLVYHANITLQQALTGIKMTLPTLDNRSVEVVIRDQIITPNYVHRISSEGMPKKGGYKGDMLVKFNIRFPTHLNDSQKDQIKAAFKGTTWA